MHSTDQIQIDLYAALDDPVVAFLCTVLKQQDGVEVPASALLRYLRQQDPQNQYKLSPRTLRRHMTKVGVKCIHRAHANCYLDIAPVFKPKKKQPVSTSSHALLEDAQLLELLDSL